MGEAKRRGSFEQRQIEGEEKAILRQKQYEENLRIAWENLSPERKERIKKARQILGLTTAIALSCNLNTAKEAISQLPTEPETL